MHRDQEGSLTVLYRDAWRGTGPRPTVKRVAFFIVARGPVPRDRWGARAMARDRPSPYGAGVAFFIVARGPVPRDRWIARAMARDRPSPYGEEGAPAVLHRDAWRGTGPRSTVKRSLLQQRFYESLLRTRGVRVKFARDAAG